MELVLGLAALATAVSGMAGVGHFTDASNIKEAETVVVDKKNQAEHALGDTVAEASFEKEAASDLLAAPRKAPAKAAAIQGIAYEAENNNTFELADEIGSNNYTFASYSGSTKPSDFTKTVYGSVGQTSDIDFFKFTLYGKADVTIELKDIPNQCDYDIVFYAHGNNRVNAAEEKVEMGGSYSSSNNPERIKQLLYPNTYYVKVYSYRGYGSPQYTLTLNVKHQRKDESIAAMKRKGARGALWLSDYDPYGIKPSISDSRIPINQSEFTDSSIAFPVRIGSYKHAELFVFDDVFKRQMFNFVDTLYRNVESSIQNEEEIVIQKKKVSMGESFFWTIVGLCGPIGTAVSLGHYTQELRYGIAELAVPEENMVVTKTNYLIYLNGLRNALNWYNPLAEPGRVLSIPINYRVVRKQSSSGYIPVLAGFIQTDCYITYEPITNTQLFEYRNDTIYAQSPSNPITGTIYPIADDDSIHMAFNREAYPTTVYGIGNNVTSASFSLSKGQYRWYTFTAPRAGTYYFTSEGDSRATLDVFDRVVYGKSDYSRITREYHSINVGSGFSYSTYMYAGQVRYFRISGGCGSYTALSTTTFKVSDTNPVKLAYINANDLDIGTTWNDEIIWSDIHDPYDVYVETCGVFYNTERHSMEMRCERGGVCECAFMYLFFDRPLKSLSFGTYIGNSYSYACLGLEVRAFDDDGSTVRVDFAESYCSDEYIPNYFNYENLNPRVYGVVLTLDPNLDQSPYHVSYQEQLIGDIVVEFQI